MSNTSRIEELENEIRTLSDRLRAAQAELLEEQCAGAPRYERGTVVLVPRMLFGSTRMWPARIEGVNLHYASGEDAKGVPWEKKTVSYSVYLKQKDGSFGGSSAGYYHSEVRLAPEGAQG